MENSKFWKSHFQNLEEKIIVRPRLGSVKTWKVNKKKKRKPRNQKTIRTSNKTIRRARTQMKKKLGN